jgi:hypothetical protein
MTTRNIAALAGESKAIPARVKYIGVRGFPRRNKWSAPFVVHVFAIRPMTSGGVR